MSEQNIVNVMVIPDVPKVLPGEQLYVYVPKASFTFPGIIAYNNTQFRIDGNFLFIREDYVSPGVQQKIDELKQYTDDELQLKQDKEDNNISLAQRPEQKSVVGAINDLGTLTQEAKNAADHAQTTADNATTLANNGISKAEQAQQTADHAQQAADAAQATADNATNLANTGISKADQAQTTANTAVDKANDAKATANEAIMKADGRSNSIGFMTAKDAVTALNGYPRTQLKGGDTIWIVETGTPDLWVTEVAQESVPYNYTTKDKFNQDLVDNKVLQIGYFKTAYQESDGKPVTIAWQNVLVKSTDWVASTEFADFPYEAKIELTDFVDYTTVPQVVFDIADTMSGNYAPICKSGDKCVYIYGKVQNEITLKTVITFAPNVNGASITGGGYNNRGKWQASTTYEIDDLVYTDNGQYVCIDGITSTTSPEQDTQHWQATFIATGKTKNTLTISGQDNGTGVQKTFDGSAAVEVSFDETTMTAKEVDGVLKVGAKGTIPEALPQTAEALKSGNLPTTGWEKKGYKTFWEGDVSCSSSSYKLLGTSKELADVLYSDSTAYPIAYCYGRYMSAGDKNFSYIVGDVSYPAQGKAYRLSRYSSDPTIVVTQDGAIYAKGDNGANTEQSITYKRIGASTISQQFYTISDTSITANSDVLMELTDEGMVKAHALANGSIQVIRDVVPTSAIPYTYKVKQTNAAGQFTLLNHYIPDAPDAPTALPQEAVAVKSGELPTTGWTIAAMPLWEGDHYSAPDEGSYQLLPAGSINFDLVSKVDNTKWFVSIDGDYSATQDVLSIGTAIYVRKSNSSTIYYLIKSDGSLYCNTSGSTRVHFYGIKNAEYGKFAYGISDSSITVNSDVLMELTDSEVKSYSMEAGKITVIRDNMPTQPIPYTYKVKQTNASGQFTLVNHYVPASPTDLPVTYKKASGELPTTGWSQLGWEQSTLPAARHWSCIAYGKGKFVTIAGNGSDKCAYSTDGIHWTEATMPSAELWNGIAYGNGKFVAVATSTDKGAYSVDGINWTLTTMPSSPGYKDWIGVAYGNGKFVTLTLESSYCAYSNDGITWTATTLPTKRNWRRIAYGNDKFVAIAKGTDKGAYSTDGVTWTEMTLPASRNWQGITYGEDKFIAIAGSSDKGAYSTDGINWTEMTLPESRDWYCTAYGNGKFVAIEYNGLRAAYSTDGITWLSLNTPIIRSWCGVVYGDNKFVVVSRDASVSSQNNKALYWEVDSKFTYTISDTFITTNTSVKMYLTDEGGVKALRRANGSITVLRGMVPTTVIPYEYEVKQTSTSGLFEVINAYIPDVPTVPTKTSQLENDSNFAKTNTPNSWGSTQTFTAYDGIKTNRICNAAGTSLVDGTGTTNKFGNGNMPTIIKTSEARPKAEVPYADGTATRQIALLEDIPSMVIDWVGPSATEQVITGTGMRQIFAEFTDTVGDVSTVYKFYGEVYVDGQNEVNGTSSTVYSTNTEGTELHVITVTPTIRRNTDNQFVLRAECCRYTIGASPMSINKSYLSFVFRKRLY